MPDQRRVADFPRPPATEPVPLPVRIVFAGEMIVRTTRAWRVLETTHPPTYYLPAADFRPGTLVPRTRTTFCEWKGVAHYVSVHATGQVAEDAGWLYPDPSPAYAMLRDHVAIYAGRMEACYVGDERVTPQPGGFYGGWITAAFVGPFKGGPGTQFW